MEATSLGLKIKLGLGPNDGKYQGLYISENVTVTVVTVTYSKVHHELAVLSIVPSCAGNELASIMTWQ